MCGGHGEDERLTPNDVIRLNFKGFFYANAVNGGFKWYFSGFFLLTMNNARGLNHSICVS